jgi:hypothetical protein
MKSKRFGNFPDFEFNLPPIEVQLKSIESAELLSPVIIEQPPIEVKLRGIESEETLSSFKTISKFPPVKLEIKPIKPELKFPDTEINFHKPKIEPIQFNFEEAPIKIVEKTIEKESISLHSIVIERIKNRSMSIKSCRRCRN